MHSETNDVEYYRCVGTYHKTGTVWMKRIFKMYAEKYGLIFHHLETDGTVDNPSGNTIYFSRKSNFSFLNKKVEQTRGVRIIRDPRDVLISGCFYHQRSKEPWLHKSHARLDGMSYAEKINSYKSFDDKMLFELNNATKGNIFSASHIYGSRENTEVLARNFLTIKFEDLRKEDNSQHVLLMAQHLQLDQLNMLNNFNRISTGLARAKGYKHIRTKQDGEWRKYFSRSLAEEFRDQFQDCLQILGYEDNTDWVQQCNATPESIEALQQKS